MRIGVFCSGGDAPGMNACVRAVVRSAIAAGHEVVGICRGYQGLLEEDFYRVNGEPRMTLRSVSGLVQRGGTILRSSRSARFMTEEGQREAAEVLRRHRIDALVPIGGDGTFRGAEALLRVWDGQIVGTPGTIDNDLFGTDYTIGFHTAVATAVEMVDKVRDTAESHDRMFLVEVMGRRSGYIALHTALACGAEFACIPETPTDVHQLVEAVQAHRARGKTSLLFIVAEGDETGGAMALREQLSKAGCPMESRVVVLGHTQRGGSPVPADRLLASKLGDFAVRSILAGNSGAVAGEVAGQLVLTPLEQAYQGHKSVPADLVRLLEVLAM